MTATRVKRILREHLGVDEDRLHADARMVDDLGCDSLDHVELQLAMEEEFGIIVTDDEAEGCTTVGNWLDLVQQKAGEAA